MVTAADAIDEFYQKLIFLYIERGGYGLKKSKC